MKPATIRSLPGVALCMILLSGCGLTSTGRGAWLPAPATAAGLHVSTATVLGDNRVLATGWTTDSAGAHHGVAEIFDPSAHAWTPAAAPPAALIGPSATLLQDGSVLVAGGSIGPVPQTHAWIYVPASSRWQPAGDMLEPRSEQTATRLRDGRVLITGGLGPLGVGAPLDSAELYDPDARRWSAAGHLTAGRFGHAAVLLEDGRVLVAGGSGISSAITIAELYDPQRGAWTLGGSFAWPAEPANMVRLADGRVLLAGGGILPLASLFDPMTSKWKTAGQMPTLTSGALFLLPDHRALAVKTGGRSDAPVFRGEIYDPATDRWIVTDIQQGRPDAAVALRDGRVLVLGGGSAWLYDASAFPVQSSGSDALNSPHLTVALAGVILLTLLVLGAQMIRDRLGTARPGGAGTISAAAPPRA